MHGTDINVVLNDGSTQSYDILGRVVSKFSALQDPEMKVEGNSHEDNMHNSSVFHVGNKEPFLRGNLPDAPLQLFSP